LRLKFFEHENITPRPPLHYHNLNFALDDPY